MSTSPNSIASRFRALCWRASCSAMSWAPSRVRSRRRWGAFRRLTAEHCFWMKSEIFRLRCNQNGSTFFKKSSSNVWAAVALFKSTCGLSRLPTKTCGAWSKNGNSAPIFTQAQCISDHDAAIAGTRRRHPAADRTFRSNVREATRQVDQSHPR